MPCKTMRKVYLLKISSFETNKILKFYQVEFRKKYENKTFEDFKFSEVFLEVWQFVNNLNEILHIFKIFKIIIKIWKNNKERQKGWGGYTFTKPP